MTLCTKADYSRRHGVSKAAVQKWEKNNWLVMVDGSVDIEKSDAQLDRYRHSKDGRARKPASSPVEPSETPQQAAERILRDFGADMSFEEAKRVKENYLALLNQLEYDQKARAVVAVDDVASVVGQAFAKARTRLMAIPSEHAPQVQRLKTVTEVQDYLHSIIVEALTELTYGSG